MYGELIKDCFFLLSITFSYCIFTAKIKDIFCIFKILSSKRLW